MSGYNPMNDPNMMKMMNDPQFMQMMNNPQMQQQMQQQMNNQMMMNPMMINPVMMNPMMMNPMMFQQFNNNIQPNMPMPNINAPNPGGLNLIFEKKRGGQIINVQVSPDDTVQTAINLYRIKTNTPQEEEIKCIYNGKQLNYGLTLSVSGLMNGSKVIVISTKDVEGVNFLLRQEL